VSCLTGTIIPVDGQLLRLDLTSREPSAAPPDRRWNAEISFGSRTAGKRASEEHLLSAAMVVDTDSTLILIAGPAD
jgi:hypothetical protein